MKIQADAIFGRVQMSKVRESSLNWCSSLIETCLKKDNRWSRFEFWRNTEEYFVQSQSTKKYFV